MFIKADSNSQAVVGVDTYEKLQLMKRTFNINTNLPAFLGKYLKFLVKLKLWAQNITADPSIPPVINPSRKIPYALKKRLKWGSWT